MSLMGLGRVKTPGPAVRVEAFRIIRHHESQNVLHVCCSTASWRIVFSTFLRCMSFHTTRTRCGSDEPQDHGAPTAGNRQGLQPIASVRASTQQRFTSRAPSTIHNRRVARSGKAKPSRLHGYSGLRYPPWALKAPRQRGPYGHSPRRLYRMRCADRRRPGSHGRHHRPSPFVEHNSVARRQFEAR
jgi:hypothetical protein